MFQTLKEKIKKILIWSQKYTKTDMLYLARGGFWLTIKQLAVSASAFLLTIILTRLLDKEVFGTYKYVLSLFSIFCITALTGAHTAITRAAAMGKHTEIYATLKTRIKFGTIGMAVAVMGAIYYHIRGNDMLASALAIISIFIPFFEPLNTFDAILMGNKHFKQIAGRQITIQLVNLLAMSITAYFTNNLVLLLLSYLLPITLVRVILNLIEIKKYGTTPGDETKEIIKYGKHLSIIDIFNSFIKNIDKILVFQFLGSADLALYVIATNPLEYLSTFIANIQHLAFPKLVLSNESKWNKKLFKVSAILALTLSITIACYWLAAPMIYKIFFPQYQASVFLSRIYSISLITIVGVVPNTMLQANKKIKRLYAFNASSSVASLIILLISLKFGLVGIAIGRVIARFCGLLITYIATINTSQLKTFNK